MGYREDLETNFQPRWLERPTMPGRNTILIAWVCVNTILTVWLLAGRGGFVHSDMTPLSRDDALRIASNVSGVASEHAATDAGPLPTAGDEHDAMVEFSGLAPLTTETPGPIPDSVHNVDGNNQAISPTGLVSSTETVYGDKVAVVIETKVVPNLVPIMLHFAQVLGATWSIVLFTLESSFDMPTSIPFQRALSSNQIRIAYLPSDTDFSTHESVSLFFTRPWLWSQLQTAHRILLFQTDSILCARSNVSIDAFLEWDFVGAPIAENMGLGYNGGLSIRNPRLLLNITSDPDGEDGFAADRKAGKSDYEDQWFFKKLGERDDARLPPMEVAMTFAVESVYYETPLGYHQPHRWRAGEMEQVLEWCPEVGMLSGSRYK